MKILTVCSSWRVFGAETITLKMLEGFNRRGHEQIAITSIWTDGDFSGRLAKLGLREAVMPFGAIIPSWSPRYMKWTADCVSRLPVLWWKWRRVMRAFKPDVILWTGSKQVLLLLPWLGKTPSFLIEHTNVVPSRNVRWLYRQLAARLQGFIAVSDFMRTHLHGLGAPLERIHVIKNGAFFERELAAIGNRTPASARRVGEPVRLGIAGQIAPHKGHECLLNALRILNTQGIQACVNVFGSGNSDYVAQLRRLIAAAGLEGSWHWMGYESDPHKIYGAMDICVMPSCFEEPFGMVAAEASAYGLPVVASRRGGLPEIIEDGVTGHLVESDSPEQLAAMIRDLHDHPQKAREMGNAGRDRMMKHFTMEKMILGFEQVFKAGAARAA